MRFRSRGCLHTILPALVLSTVFLLAMVPQEVSAETILLDHFAYGNTNATVNFTYSNISAPPELLIEIPRGAAVIDANVSVRGIMGPGMANVTMDYSTHAVGADLWARHEEATDIVPVTVDPFNSTWDAMPSAQVANISQVDGKYWHTQTPSVPTAAPWEWPVQLYHFRPNVADAYDYQVQWLGKGYCAANNTYTKYHAAMWLYDFRDQEWDGYAQMWDWEDRDRWINYSFFSIDPYISANGSVAIAISGVHADVNGTLKDRGHLYTNYIGLVAIRPSTHDEYPEDVTLRVFDTYMQVAPGSLMGKVVVGRAAGLPDAIQAHINDYPNQPGNVTVDIAVLVARPTFAQVEISDLHITYDDTGVIPNDPPEWVGPSEVEVREDAGWKAVLDMDLAFTDDYDQGRLEFEVVDIGTAYLDARLREGVLNHMWLEVRPADDFHGEVDVVLGATDSGGESAQSSPMTVKVLPVPDPPFMVELGVIPVNETERLNFTLLVLDPDMPDDKLTFSDNSKLFDVDPDEGSIDWTPGPEHIGTHTCQVTVRDSYGLTDRMTLIIEVLNVNDPPKLTSPLSVDALEGQKVHYTITAEDPDLAHGDSLTYSASSLVVAVQVNPSSGQLTFQAEMGFVGDVRVLIQVTDILGASDHATLVVRVGNVNEAPTLVDPGMQTYSQGDAVSLRLVVEDPDLEQDLPEPEAHTFTTDGPLWLAANEWGWVNLTVEQHMVGDHLVQYTVTDRGGLKSIVSVIWTLRDVNDVPVITTQVPEVVTALEDEPFALTLESTDLDGDLLTWSDDSPLFDIGASSGRISFTPGQMDVGTHMVTLQVSDGRGGTAELSFELRVENVNDAPSVLEVEPSNGSIFKVGQAIAFHANATDEDGDDLAYTWMEGAEVLGTGRDLSYSQLRPGEHTVTLVVDDGTDQTTLDLTVKVKRRPSTEDTPGFLVVGAIAAMALVALLGRDRW